MNVDITGLFRVEVKRDVMPGRYTKVWFEANEPGEYDVQTCIGKTGRVYLRLPEKGQGRGQVQITVSGNQRVLEAVSTGEAIESFATVKIVGIEGVETLVAERN